MIQPTLKKLLIKTRKQVFSEIPGNNPSLFKGEGFDFVELREYQPGDDIKRIDWLATAKLQRPFVRVYKEERELNVVVALMLSGSTYFGTKRFKYELMAEIGAILGWSAIKNQDRFSYILFADKEYGSIRPTKSLHAIARFLDQSLSFDPLGKGANWEELVARLFGLKRKSIVFLVSDFLSLPQLGVLARKHEVVAIVVRDRFEEEPAPVGFIDLIDPITREHLLVDLEGATLLEYKKRIKAHDRQLLKTFRKHAIRFTKIYTHEEPFIKLLKLFGARS
ncbi:MAG: DUF58 domain-containing protein [Nitratiruptor sp.]|nr:DUF58 domain-containing protein [Nitratiruptor sp.]NPA82845.1 DUF58 domain-containing protein [Campylobacterota bacterium]